ncbi:MAG: response regulator [Cyanobacteria bacterium J06627_28]
MPHHILVVDDETDVESLISQRFRREIRQGAYTFSFASNGVEALEHINQSAGASLVDLVLTDINMPEMDGLTLISNLKQLKHPPKTIVVSAYSDINNIRTAMNRGAFDFVTKPINFQDLSITLARALRAVDEENKSKARLARSQSQLVQSEKMSALGGMVAGVAHEINNPINFIYGNLKPARSYVQDLSELIALYQEKYPTPDQEIQDLLEEINLPFLQEDLNKLFDSLDIGAARIRDLVLSLRNFSRLDEAEKKQVDIHEGIDSTLLILGNRLKATPERPPIQIERAYGLLPKVECYPSQLNQVIMNLLANAIDAFEEFDRARPFKEVEAAPNVITISTERVEETSIKIEIVDNGPGIPSEVQARLFDPFFTTKAVGKGTGLGLSISHEIIVQKHGGHLSCLSEVGQGARFVVEIPI